MNFKRKKPKIRDKTEISGYNGVRVKVSNSLKTIKASMKRTLDKFHDALKEMND